MFRNKVKRQIKRNMYELFQFISPDNPPDVRMESGISGLNWVSSIDDKDWPKSIKPRSTVIGLLHSNVGRAAILKSNELDQNYKSVALQHLEAATKHLNETNGLDWVDTAMALSIAYADYGPKSKDENYMLAEQVLRRPISFLRDKKNKTNLSQQELFYWRRCHANLARYFLEKQHGSRSENLREALGAHQITMDSISKTHEPVEWAHMASGMAELLSNDRSENRQQSMKEAIAMLDDALAIPMFRGSVESATSIASLINCLSSVNTAISIENLARIKSLSDELVTLIDSQKSPHESADLKGYLAATWMEKDFGKSKEGREFIEKLLTEALAHFSNDQQSELYWRLNQMMLSFKGDGGSYSSTEQEGLALENVRQLHAKMSFEKDGRKWIDTQHRLATDLSSSANRCSKADIEEAIKLFNEILVEIDADKNRRQWIETTAALANAHAIRKTGDIAKNIDLSIQLLEACLERLNDGQDGGLWSHVAINLAMSYRERLLGSSRDNMEMAFALATLVRTNINISTEPLRYAMACENLGEIYGLRTRGQPVENARAAVRILDMGLEALSGTDEKVSRSRIQQKLYDAQRGLKSIEKRDEVDSNENGPSSTTLFFETLRSRIDKIDPTRDFSTWFVAKMQLGQALTQIPQNSEGESPDLETMMSRMSEASKEAIQVFESVFDYLNVEEDPVKNFRVWRAIGSSHELIAIMCETERFVYSPEARPDVLSPKTIVRQRLELAHADAAYEKAFQAIKHISMPREKLDIHLRHGGVRFQLEQWGESLESFQRAGPNVEDILGLEDLDQSEAIGVLNDIGNLATMAPLASIKSQDPLTALTIAEASRTRLMAKALSLAFLPFSEQQRLAYKICQERINVLEEKLDSPFTINVIEPLKELMSEKDKLTSLVSEASTHTSKEKEDITSYLNSILKEDAILVYPFIYKDGGHAIIAYLDSQKLKIRVSSFQAPNLYTLYTGHPKLKITGWKHIYQRYITGKLHDMFWKKSLDSLSKQVSKAFWSSILEAIPKNVSETATNIYLVPTGVTGYFPLAIGTDLKSGQSILDKYALSLIPSISVAQIQSSRAVTEPINTIAIFAGAETDLPASRIERLSITSLFKPSHIFLGDEHNIHDLLRRSSIWHFATHGRYDSEVPEQSGLQISDNTWLTVSDIQKFEPDILPELVVLSACETALYGEKQLPNELIGLSGAFLQMGARNVLSTLWPVKDIPSALLTIKFYQNRISRGRPAPDALRHAQLWLKNLTIDELKMFLDDLDASMSISTGEKTWLMDRVQSLFYAKPGQTPFSHPVYWAGFICYGV